MAVEQYNHTAQEIIDSVFRQFGDESGAQINQTDVIRWINEAQRDVVVNNREVNQAIATFATEEGTGIYDISAMIPGILRIHSLAFKGRILDNLTFEDAQAKMVNESQEGVPKYWFKYAGQLNLWPIPKETESAAITVYYNKAPVAVSQGTDRLTVPENYYEAVNAFCLAKAYELDGDSQMLGIKKEDYNRNLVLNSNDNVVSGRDFPVIREVDY